MDANNHLDSKDERINYLTHVFYSPENQVSMHAVDEIIELFCEYPEEEKIIQLLIEVIKSKHTYANYFLDRLKNISNESSYQIKNSYEKIISLLHMARKAGKILFGFDACERACLKGKAFLILAAGDLADRQKASLRTVAEANNVKFFEFASKHYLGTAFKIRDIGIICVQDKNFASGIVQKFN